MTLLKTRPSFSSSKPSTIVKITPFAAAFLTFFTQSPAVLAQSEPPSLESPIRDLHVAQTDKVKTDLEQTPVHQVHVRGERNDYAAGLINGGKLRAEARDIAQSVTVVNKELMQAQGANSLAEALRNVSGITLSATEGGRIGNNINLNGFSAKNDIYLDGFRDRGQYFRDTFALDSIEVLMGPSSMLFGRGSTGGVVNQVSKKPTLKESSEIQGSVTSTGLVRSTFDVNNPLSENAAVRVLGMAQAGDGSTRDLTLKKDAGLAATLKLGINTPTEITLSALLQSNNDMVDVGILSTNGAPHIDRNWAYGLQDDRTISKIASVNALVEHRLSNDTTWRNNFQANGVRTDVRATIPKVIGTISSAGFTALPLEVWTTMPLNQLAVMTQSRDREITDYSVFNQTELVTKWTSGAVEHQLIAGVEVGHDGYTNQYYGRQGQCAGVPLNKPNSTTVNTTCVSLLHPANGATPATMTQFKGNLAGGSANTYAAYINDTMQMGAHFKLLGGLRYDRFIGSYTNSINASNTAGNTKLAGASQAVGFTSVRLGVMYQPDDVQSYYLSYGNSFNPSLEEMTGTTGQQNLAPEKNASTELGGKWQFTNKSVDASAAVFQIKKENARNLISVGEYDLVGQIRVNGFRTGLAGRINKQWQMALNYTYLDAKIVEATDTSKGKVPLNTPKNSLSSWVTYQMSPAWEVGGGAVYMSERFINPINSASAGGYTRWDATIAYNQPRYSIRLNVLNLTDKFYLDELAQAREISGGRVVPAAGRTAMLSFAYRF